MTDDQLVQRAAAGVKATMVHFGRQAALMGMLFAPVDDDELVTRCRDLNCIRHMRKLASKDARPTGRGMRYLGVQDDIVWDLDPLAKVPGRRHHLDGRCYSQAAYENAESSEWHAPATYLLALDGEAARLLESRAQMLWPTVFNSTCVDRLRRTRCSIRGTITKRASAAAKATDGSLDADDLALDDFDLASFGGTITKRASAAAKATDGSLDADDLALDDFDLASFGDADSARDAKATDGSLDADDLALDDFDLASFGDADSARDAMETSLELSMPLLAESSHGDRVVPQPFTSPARPSLEPTDMYAVTPEGPDLRRRAIYQPTPPRRGRRASPGAPAAHSVTEAGRSRAIDSTSPNRSTLGGAPLGKRNKPAVERL